MTNSPRISSARVLRRRWVMLVLLLGASLWGASVLGDEPSEATSDASRATELYNAGRYTEATTVQERVVEQARRDLPENSPALATALDNLALLYHVTGNYGAALPLLEEALQIRRAALGDDHPSTALSLNNLAELHSAKRDYDTALPLYEEALAVRRAALGDAHPDTATSLNNLAELYQAMGDYDAALPLQKEALQVHRSALGDTHPDTATSLNNLAALYQAIGDYDAALPLYEEALEIERSALGDAHPDTATSLNNLAALYQAMGDYDAALPLYEEALEIRRAALGDAHPDTALSLNNLAELHRALGDHDSALPLHEEALEIRRGALGDDHPETAQSLNNLALLYQALSEDDAALRLHEAALEIRRGALGDDHPDTATSLNNLAVVHHALGEDDAALRLHEAALEIRRAALGDAHPETAQSLNNLAALYQALGEDDAALPLYEEARAIEERSLERMLASAYHGERELLAYLDTIDRTTDGTLSFHLDGDHSTASAALAMETVVRRKGRVLETRAARQQSLRAELDEEGRALHAEFAAVTSRLSALTMNPPPMKSNELTELRSELMSRAEELESKLRARSTAFAARTESVTIEALAAALPRNAALVEIVAYRPFDARSLRDRWGDSHYAVAVLRPDAAVAWVDLGLQSDIDALVQGTDGPDGQDQNGGLLACLSSPRCPIAEVHERSRALHAAVIEPLEPHLEGADHLFVAPDATLNLVPFETLIDSEGHYLLQTHQITYLTSGRDLLRIRTIAEDETIESGPDVLVSAPNYREAAAAVSTVDAPTFLAEPLGLDEDALCGHDEEQLAVLAELERSADAADVRSADLKSQPWNPLPGTELEARTIAPLLGEQAALDDVSDGGTTSGVSSAPRARFARGAHASEALLRSLDGPRVLHVATHGFFLTDLPQTTRETRSLRANLLSSGAAPSSVRIEDPMQRSGLALAGASYMAGDGTESAENDGILTAEDVVVSLDLWGTRLVVLSACETGVGVVRNGQGVYGLRRALVLAGAQTQVMSLWKVDDCGTAELMRRFYARLNAGEGRSQALRHAKLELLASDEWAHPYYWAPFIGGGDWRTLDGELPKDPVKTYESLEAVQTEMRPGACGCRVLGAERHGEGVPSWLWFLGLAAAGFVWRHRAIASAPRRATYRARSAAEPEIPDSIQLRPERRLVRRPPSTRSACATSDLRVSSR